MLVSATTTNLTSYVQRCLLKSSSFALWWKGIGQEVLVSGRITLPLLQHKILVNLITCTKKVKNFFKLFSLTLEKRCDNEGLMWALLLTTGPM
jgi:hypothetical protein